MFSTRRKAMLMMALIDPTLLLFVVLLVGVVGLYLAKKWLLR